MDASESPSTESETYSKVKPLTASLIKDRHEKGIKAIAWEIKEYWLNYSFERGRQWLYWNKKTNKIDDVERVKGRYQATMNRISSNSRTIMSKAMQRELQFDVPPNGADDDSVLGARTSQAVLSEVHRTHNWEAKREENLWGTWLGGTAAICVDWDPEAGTKIHDQISIGDTVETTLTIPEFVPQPGVRDAETGNWWIKAVVLPPEQAQEMYDLAKCPPADAQSSKSPYNQRVVSSDDQAMNMVDGTLVLTYYERPNKLRPEGAVAVVIDNKIVEEMTWPFPFTDHLNFAVTRETVVNGRSTGETCVSKARPVQTALNASWSNMLEHLKKVGNARLLLPQSQSEMVDKFTDDPGVPLTYIDDFNKPEYMNPPQLPQWVQEIIDRLAKELDDVLGVHDVSRGTAPTNAPDSGYGLSILSENDNTPIGRLTKEVAFAWSKVATMVLELYAANVTETRPAVVRSGPVPETVKWTGKSLAGQTTAFVPPDAIMPRSRAAIQKWAEQFMQMRPEMVPDAATYADLAELPGREDIVAAVDPDTSKAMRENAVMAEGVVCLPAPFDDHTKHIARHNRFRKTARYEGLPKEARFVVDRHIEAHEKFAAEAAGAQVSRQMMNPALGGIATANEDAPIDMSAMGGAVPPPPEEPPLTNPGDTTPYV